jgi:CheY-like chemotaxis protein
MQRRRHDKVNILLVDDQPARLMSYESILRDLGQNLVMARSGGSARTLMANEFAVVLLDVNMPGMDGFETASMIHEHPRFEKTPIIFITGVHVSELDRLQGYKLGAVDYVSIPVVPEILRSKVAVLVELYCQRRELQRLNQQSGAGQFNLFTQADATAHRAQGGLGIGLALVRKLVEMHGGTVSAYSEGANRGSEFVMRLPLLVRHTVWQRVSVPTEPRGAEQIAPRRILVADDNSDSLESLATLLRCDGHEVCTAADGEEAYEQAQRHRPEIALLDIGMPKLDGYQVSCRIRAESWGRAMVLVALTGWGQDGDRKRSKAAGFDAHVVKPLDLGALAPYLRLPSTDNAVAQMLGAASTSGGNR